MRSAVLTLISINQICPAYDLCVNCVVTKLKDLQAPPLPPSPRTLPPRPAPCTCLQRFCSVLADDRSLVHTITCMNLPAVGRQAEASVSDCDTRPAVAWHPLRCSAVLFGPVPGPSMHLRTYLHTYTAKTYIPTSYTLGPQAQR